MKTFEFETQINAPAQQVWDILWGTDTYKQWTQYFNPGSEIKSDWEVGGKTLFLDGKGNGMISTIQSKDAPHELVFKHLGSVENGVEDTESEKVKTWAGILEKYYLTHQNGVTNLKAIVDGPEEFGEMLQNGFTKGLEKVKELAEK